MIKGEQLWVLDIVTGRWNTRSPKSVGSRPNLYNVSADGLAVDVLEKGFDHDIESPAAVVIQKLDMADPTLYSNDREALVRYVALLLARHPNEVESWKNFMSDLGEITLNHIVRFQRPDIDPKKFNIGVHQNYQMKSLVERLKMFETLLQGRTWSIFKVEDDAGHFVCGDRPFAIAWGHDPSEARRTGRPPLASPDSLLLIPLSWQMTLIGGFGGESGIGYADRKFVSHHNTLMVRSSNQLVFSPRNDFSLMEDDGSIVSVSSLFNI